MRTDTNKKFNWTGKLEQLEDRQMMSADPIGGLLGGAIEHHAIVDEMPPLNHHNLPPLDHHVESLPPLDHHVESLPPLDHHVESLPPLDHHVESLPPLDHHVESLPPLDHHVESEPDFWIDSRDLDSIENSLREIETALEDAHSQTGLDNVRANYGFTGIGQTVAVIDSGIAYDHFALGGGFGQGYRVVGGWDFTGENDANPYDDGPEGSHGTHVAGIVGGDSGNDTGVAPGVDLVALRVFDDVGNGYFSWVENALDWIHTNRNSFENPITAVNLSLGVSGWNSDTIPAWANLEDEFAQLEADGIFISVSAGNGFTSYNSPGLSYPAASSYVIPVMSTDDSGLLSYFSQRHSRAIAAPGRWITSTVPDYAGNNNNIADDYATMSGTSMAAPYVAGASVIIREAMEFAGYTNITQDTIYDHMIATADSFFDSATNQYYNRLNLEAAINALMPADDYGSSAVAAYDLGTIGNSMQMGGAITTLSDVDYFSFTAENSGSVTFEVTNSTHEFATSWIVNNQQSLNNLSTNGNQVTIDVVAGQEYSVGLASSDGLGYYDFDITADSQFTYTDWGIVTLNEIQGISATNDTWYQIEATKSGYMSVESFFDGNNGQISLELYNANFTLLDSGNAANNQSRVDSYSTQGDIYYVRVLGSNTDVDFRLANLLEFDGTIVNVSGTSADDTFTLELGELHHLNINGVDYDLVGFAVSEINIDGGDGNDSISITGTSADETAILRVGQAQFSSSTYAVDVVQVESITIDAGTGVDRAYLFDSASNDILIADSESAHMTGDGFSNLARGFDLTYSYATAGGTDRVYLKDSAGNDSYVGRQEYSRLSGAGFYNYTQGFDLVYAFSTKGGDDTAYLYDTVNDDTFIARPEYARISGVGYYNYTQGFSNVNAYATAGGNDVTYLYDSVEDDIFTSRPEYGRLAGEGFNNYANGFDAVYAYSTAGGTDLAYLYDSEFDDIFTSRPEYGRMSGEGFYNHSSGFDQVFAYATAGGNDYAYMYDSIGDDIFVARPDYGRMSGEGFYNYAKGFDRVNAYATAGGNDFSYFYDSIGDDDFVSRPDYGRMSGVGFNHYAKGFERVYAYATAGGNDKATLYAAESGTNFVDGPTAILMSGDSYYNYASRFELFEALTHDGNPMVDAEAVDFAFDDYNA